jgi:hypothetical protein
MTCFHLSKVSLPHLPSLHFTRLNYFCSLVAKIKDGYKFNEACDDLTLFFSKYTHV